MLRLATARAAARLLVAVLAHAGAATAAAQPAADTAPRATRTDPFCWRGRPLPRCAAFAQFELGYHWPVVTTRVREPVAALPQPFASPGSGHIRSVGGQMIWSVGAMRNRDARSAIGGVVIGGPTAGTGRGMLGAQGRYRQWTSRTTSADVGAGPIRISMPIDTEGRPFDGSIYEDRFGVAADARLSYADRVGAGVRVIAVPTGTRVHGGVLVGGNVGSGAAVAGTVGIAAFVAFLVVALAGYT
jgi:hypothetical protein